LEVGSARRIRQTKGGQAAGKEGVQGWYYTKFQTKVNKKNDQKSTFFGHPRESAADSNRGSIF
jgi:hypothetical protein